MREGIPRRFSTSSRVLIIANDWRTLNVNVSAVEDRGHLLVFEPTALEVHLRTATWFWDQEVFDWIGTHLHLIERPSMRLYYAAWEQKQAGLEWRENLLARWLSGPRLLAAQLRADPTLRHGGGPGRGPSWSAGAAAAPPTSTTPGTSALRRSPRGSCSRSPPPPGGRPSTCWSCSGDATRVNSGKG